MCSLTVFNIRSPCIINNFHILSNRICMYFIYHFVLKYKICISSAFEVNRTSARTPIECRLKVATYLEKKKWAVKSSD